jgi:hypothetical protein
MLVEHDGELKLVVEGEVFSPGDDLRGIKPEVKIPDARKSETEHMVSRWNEEVLFQRRDDTEADVEAFAEAFVNYEQPWEDRTGFETGTRNRNLP